MQLSAEAHVHYVVLTAEAAMVLASPTSEELLGGNSAAAHWAAHGTLQCALHQPPPYNDITVPSSLPTIMPPAIAPQVEQVVLRGAPAPLLQ